jgi:hypothetical protein
MRTLAIALMLAGCTEHIELINGRMDGACVAPGAPIQLTSDAPCTAALAARLLRYTLCSCEVVTARGGLYASGESSGTNMVPSAAIGTDADLAVSGPVQVAGPLRVAGPNGARFSRTAAVLGTLRSNGPVGADQLLTIGGDAFVGGDVTGRVDVANILHVTPAATVGSSVAAGAIVREAVSVQSPCGCGGTPAVDVAAAVASRASANDDKTIGLSPDAFASPAQATPLLDLACGEYFLNALRTPPGKQAALRVHGHALLAIAGDVEIGGGLRIEVDPFADLDLLVGGSLTIASGTFGADEAYQVRIWMGASTVHLFPGSSLGAVLYGPLATVVADGDLVADGALLARSFAVAGDISLHFDDEVLSGGVGCGATGENPVP